jgi:hypothetical protein
MLINNAGIMGGPLTLGLLPALRAARGARAVNLTSGGHRLSDIPLDEPNSESSPPAPPVVMCGPAAAVRPGVVTCSAPR